MRRYTVHMHAVSVSAAKTLIRVSAPSTMVLRILRAWISQSASTTSAQNKALLQRASTDGTGTAATPEKIEVGDPTATFTAVTNLTAEPTLTANPTIDEGFNFLTGWLWVPTSPEQIWVPPSGRLVLRLDLAPSPALTVSAGMVVEELG